MVAVKVGDGERIVKFPLLAATLVFGGAIHQSNRGFKAPMQTTKPLARHGSSLLLHSVT